MVSRFLAWLLTVLSGCLRSIADGLSVAARRVRPARFFDGSAGAERPHLDLVPPDDWERRAAQQPPQDWLRRVQRAAREGHGDEERRGPARSGPDERAEGSQRTVRRDPTAQPADAVQRTGSRVAIHGGDEDAREPSNAVAADGPSAPPVLPWPVRAPAEVAEALSAAPLRSPSTAASPSPRQAPATPPRHGLRRDEPSPPTMLPLLRPAHHRTAERARPSAPFAGREVSQYVLPPRPLPPPEPGTAATAAAASLPAETVPLPAARRHTATQVLSLPARAPVEWPESAFAEASSWPTALVEPAAAGEPFDPWPPLPPLPSRHTGDTPMLQWLDAQRHARIAAEQGGEPWSG